MTTVCIDVRMAGHAGIGTYIRNVVPRVLSLRPRWSVRLLTRRGMSTSDWISTGADVVPCDSDIYSLREQIELPRRLSRGARLYWAPHYVIPVASRTPLAVTVHDVGHLALADMYGGIVRHSYARAMLGLVRRRAAATIFVSEFTRREFVRYVGAPRGACEVIGEGVESRWFEPPADRSPHPRPYLLFVGSIKPHKNLRAALRAFESIALRHDIDFVIVGDIAAQRTADTDALRQASAFGDRVRVAGRVDDATLHSFFAHARALIFPSLYEGFGLPPLEAMAAGCPAVVSTHGALPETCGDAALYADAANPADIARQIEALLTSPQTRAAYVERGRARARSFSWDAAASQTADLLDRAIDER